MSRNFLDGLVAAVPFNMTDAADQRDAANNAAEAHYRRFEGLDLGDGAHVNVAWLQLVDQWGNFVTDLPIDRLLDEAGLRELAQEGGNYED